uniref:Anion exchange protein n=1 Tax=Rhabditophanes sp. KR3021 TaxID=114890 RepID=A0AC35U3I6_9BILA
MRSKTSVCSNRGSSFSINRKISHGDSSKYLTAQHDFLSDPLYGIQNVYIGNQLEGPIGNVRQVFENSKITPPSLLCELLEFTEFLYDEEQVEILWHETSRHIKYCQVVEGEGTRLSKPFVTLMNIQSLFQIRNCFKRGLTLLDKEITCFNEFVDEIILSWVQKGLLTDDNELMIREVLLAPKFHLINGKMRIPDEKGPKRKKEINFVDEDDDNESLKSFESVNKLEDKDDRFFSKLKLDTEAAIIMCGVVSRLEKPLCCFVRLKNKTMFYPNAPAHPVPTRFIFILLTPRESYKHELRTIGRTLCSMLTDEVFNQIAYKTTNPSILGDAVDEFMSQVIIIPPKKLNEANTRLDPQDDTQLEPRKIGMQCQYDDDPFDNNDATDRMSIYSENFVKISRTGRLFGGLIEDIKRKAPFYKSDFSDFFTNKFGQSLASTIFIFFVSLTSAITFGAILENLVNHEIAAIENILAGAISGILFSLFSGQPLTIISAAMPSILFESIMYAYCKSNQWDFLPFRFWVGIFIAIYLTIFVAFDVSALVSLITRYTEECFTMLISAVFISQAFEDLNLIGRTFPIARNIQKIFDSPCSCNLTDTIPTTMRLQKKVKNFDPTGCWSLGGVPSGLMCSYKPDIFLFSILLTLGTFFIAFLLYSLRNSSVFSTKVRHSLADFNVVIAIIIMTICSHSVGLDVPILEIPNVFKPTLNRPWLVNPLQIKSYELIGYAATMALIYTILMGMDQQITTSIVSRPDNLLKKSHGFHLDLLVVALLVVVCSFFGLPFYVGNTVLSLMHVEALKVYSTCQAPGENLQLLGIKEQRLTGAIAHLLMGLSIFLTDIIKLIPLPVLIGVFLYLGICSLSQTQFSQRCRLFLTPLKFIPDYYPWLRLVRMKRVHFFTITQIICITALFAVKYNEATSILFPLMLLGIVIIRLTVLPVLFNQNELLSLDEYVPQVVHLLKPEEPQPLFSLESRMSTRVRKSTTGSRLSTSGIGHTRPSYLPTGRKFNSVSGTRVNSSSSEAIPMLASKDRTDSINDIKLPRRSNTLNAAVSSFATTLSTRPLPKKMAEESLNGEEV